MKRVYIPATSGNMGVGFDSTGLSIALFNYIDFKVCNNGVLTIEQAEPNDAIPLDESNLVYRAAQYAAEQIGKPLPPLYLKQYNNIPLESGLGSSAACIVGGILIANDVLSAGLAKDELLKLATDLEGHPDNAAPALFGRVTVSKQRGRDILTHVVPVQDSLSLCVLSPKLSLATKEARAILPTEVPMADAVHNLASMGFLISALYEEKYEYLREALDDRLHQPYRKQLIPRFDDILNTAYALGAYGACLSGAGPTILTFIGREEKAAFAQKLQTAIGDFEGAWQVIPTDIDHKGAYIEVFKKANIADFTNR